MRRWMSVAGCDVGDGGGFVRERTHDRFNLSDGFGAGQCRAQAVVCMGGAESAPFDGHGYDGRMHRERRFVWAEPGNVR